MFKVLFLLVTLSIIALQSAQNSRAFAATLTNAERSSSLLLLLSTSSKSSPCIASSTEIPTDASAIDKASITKSLSRESSPAKHALLDLFHYNLKKSPSTISKSTTPPKALAYFDQCPVTTAYDYWVECASVTTSGQTMSCITISTSLTTGCSALATTVTSTVAPACLYGNYSGDENGEDGGCPTNIPCDQYFCSGAAVSGTGTAPVVCQYAFYGCPCTFGTSTPTSTSSTTSSSCSSSPLTTPTGLLPDSQVLYAIIPCYAILEFIYNADQLAFVQSPNGMSIETIQNGNEIEVYLVGSTTSSDGNNNYVISVSPMMFTVWAGTSGVLATATMTTSPGPSNLWTIFENSIAIETITAAWELSGVLS